jgi:hypothetical protein
MTESGGRFKYAGRTCDGDLPNWERVANWDNSTEDSKKTDLERISFLWLNGDSGFFLVQGPKSKVVSTGARGRRSAQRQLLPARSGLTKCHPKGVWCGHLFSIGS